MTVRHALQLKPGRIHRENPWLIRTATRRFLAKTVPSKRKACRQNKGTKGSGALFLPNGTRQQRVTIKAAYAKNIPGRSWAAHGHYLQRTHAQHDHQKGQGFNLGHDAVDITKTLNDWQRSGTERFFKIIISPEFAERIELPTFSKRLLPMLEQDLQTSLQWVAIDHYNTDHPHVHLLIRGINDNSEPLRIDEHYLSHGIRQRAQELLTQQLGLRTTNDFSLSRSRQIDKDYRTQIDRSLRYKADNGRICYENRIPNNPLSRERRLQEIARLKYLETLGLATRIGRKSWRISDDLEQTLHELQLSNDIIKSRAQHGLKSQDLRACLKPTQITEDKPLVGNVIGMGLNNELHDRRYLLIDGIDGCVHYVLAGGSIVKARDERRVQNGDVVALERRQFTTGKGKTVAYLAITNYHTLNDLKSAPQSRLDDDVILAIKQHGTLPALNNDSRDFANHYHDALIGRLAIFEQQGIVIKQGDKHLLTSTYETKLDELQYSRITAKYQRWVPKPDCKKTATTIAGKVVASNERTLLLHDIRGDFYQVKMADCQLQPRKVGSFVSISPSSSSVVSDMSDRPAVCIPLKDSPKLSDKKRYTILDRLLAHLGPTSKLDESWLAQMMCEREQLWASRGIAVNKRFSQRAYEWYQQVLGQEIKRGRG